MLAFQALMRIVYAIFCRSDIKSTTLTMENFVGKGHGPFVPTSVECYALAMVVCEAVGVSMISTPQSNSKHGIPGCDSPASARCGPLRAGPCAMSRCRSNELESETGKQKFAAYLRDVLYGPKVMNDRTHCARARESVTLDSLGGQGKEIYKEVVCLDHALNGYR